MTTSKCFYYDDLIQVFLEVTISTILYGFWSQRSKLIQNNFIEHVMNPYTKSMTTK